jgi:lysophospholipase L1-like esterase
VIEAGLNGRNPSFDETQVVMPSINGLADLPLILEMNYPLDLVILMLGTNDVKMEFQTPAARTAQAMKKLIGIVKNCHFGPDYAAPQVLLIAPPPLHKINSEDFRSLYNDSSIAETQKLPPLYAKLAEQEQCPFIDASKIIQISSKDGVHFDREGHTELAQAIAKKIEAMKL